jgi:uncharacterized RDD family membrane protein YckC
MPTDNPYASPKATLEQDIVIPPHEPLEASRWSRFGTFVVDYLFFLGLAIVVGIIAALAGMGNVFETFGVWEERLFGILLMLLYYTFFEGLFARTPAKWIFGTKVVALDGSEPTAGAIVIRSLCRFIPFEPLSFFGSARNGWHDRLSDTRVVSLRKVRAYVDGTLDLMTPLPRPDPAKPVGWETMSEAQRAIWEMEQQSKNKGA